METENQLMIVEADERLQQVEKINNAARDIIGRLSHLLDGVDVEDFCSITTTTDSNGNNDTCENEHEGNGGAA